MKTIALVKKMKFVVCILFFACTIQQKQVTAQNQHKNSNKLNTHVFNTQKGKITVHLPGNIYQGDVISGTVVSEPSGKNEKIKQKNAAILNKFAVCDNQKSTHISAEIIQVKIPVEQGLTNFALFLNDANGKPFSELNIPVQEEALIKFPDNALGKLPPVFPEFMESGSQAVLTGPFDGNISTTGISIAGKNANIVAESPREVVFNCPENVSGIHEIVVFEQDYRFTNEVRVVDLNLTASKTLLHKGDETTIQVSVSGLRDLTAKISLVVDNLTPEVLTIRGGNYQEINILPEYTDEQGIWKSSFEGLSVLKGNFEVSARIKLPEPQFIMPINPIGEIPFTTTPEFIWQPINLPESKKFNVVIKKTTPGEPVVAEFTNVKSPFVLPEETLLPEPGINYSWQVEADSPEGTISSAVVSWIFGPVEPADNPPGPGDPCEDPKYVENEEKECADIIRYEYEVPLNAVNQDFESFKYDWQDYFRMLTQTMLQFDLQLSMIKYWIDAGEEIDAEAQKVQKLAGLIKNGIGKGVKAFKEGGEEVMKDMAQEFAEDRVKEFEQYAVNQVSKTLGALYDLEDMAIRQIGLGIAKGLTGIYPDKMADHYRRQLQISTADLEAWVSHRVNYNSGAPHPTLQEGIKDMCNMLNQLDQIERDFEKAVEEAGFICIECEIPRDLLEMMAKLRADIETHIRMFGDTIDQIRQRLVEAKAIANNKKAYEDIARLGSFQANSAKQTEQINKVLQESSTEFQNALNARK